MKIMIVCPTAQGGHIEHAANLAGGFAHLSSDVTVISRPGASRYLSIDDIRVVEALRPLRDVTGARRVLDRAVVLAHEHVALLRLLTATRSDDTFLIFEEPRYPVPAVFSLPAAIAGRRRPRRVLFLHNVREHRVAAAGSRLELAARERFKKLTAGGFDLVVVHGEAQRDLLEPALARRAVAVQLPVGGQVENALLASSPAWPGRAEPGHAGPFVCVGHLRHNKGIDVAVQAAATGGLRLVVAGEDADAQYTASLRAQAGRAKDIEIRPGFLDLADFERLLACAGALVLPYREMRAQSGVLSRAMRIGLPIIASDIPALREQGRGYPLIRFVRPEDPDALAEAMTGLVDEGLFGSRAQGAVSADGTRAWEEIAEAIITRGRRVGRWGRGGQ